MRRNNFGGTYGVTPPPKDKLPSLAQAGLKPAGSSLNQLRLSGCRIGCMSGRHRTGQTFDGAIPWRQVRAKPLLTGVHSTRFVASPLSWSTTKYSMPV